jgi:hypothetical protein
MTLSELAKTIRSKNAGVDRITFDVIFEDEGAYQRVCRSGAISREVICRLFSITPDRITHWVAFDPARAIKFTIRRTLSSGSPGDGDIFGSQQYGPLLGLEIPVASE